LNVFKGSGCPVSLTIALSPFPEDYGHGEKTCYNSLKMGMSWTELWELLLNSVWRSWLKEPLERGIVLGESEAMAKGASGYMLGGKRHS